MKTIELQAVGLTTRKARGEAAEAAFLAKAAALGFGVAKPWGDSERYDFIVDSGHRFWRVQVKSTQNIVGTRYGVKNSGWRAAYTEEEIDFIVAYIVPEDLWYVVPVKACVGHTSLRFYPQQGSHARLEKYREAWCQLACPRGRRRTSALSPRLQTQSPIEVERKCQGRPRCPLRPQRF